MSVREIARRFGKDDSYVRRLAKRYSVERADARDIAGRIDAATQRRVAEQQAGKPLETAEAIQQAYIEATAVVVDRQRGDQRAARLLIQELLRKLHGLVAHMPEVHELLRILATKAAANEDTATEKTLFAMLDSLNVEACTRSARQLVASIKDLDGMERLAHGIKDLDKPPKGTDLQGLMDELDGADTGFGDSG